MLAAFRGRGEAEVVVRDPRLVKDRSFVEFECNFAAPLMDLMRTGPANSKLHGKRHWLRVWELVTHLSAVTPGADFEVCEAFAMCHDAFRENEHGDPEHGQRTADWASKNLGYLNTKQMAVLVRALIFHEKGITSSDPTIGCCWDADRLDLYRVGIVPATKYMSTEAGKRKATSGKI